MRWFSTAVESQDCLSAIDEITDRLKNELGFPDLLLLFISSEFSTMAQAISQRAQEKLPKTCIVGASGIGIIGGCREIEGTASISALAAVLPDVDLQAVAFSTKKLQKMGVHEWRKLVALEREQQPCFIVLSDPFSMDPSEMLERLVQAYPDSPIVGGLASGGRGPGENALFCGSEVFRDGAVILGMYGDIQMQTFVSQGCRPVGELMQITKCKKNLIMELDGKPIINKLQSLLERLPQDDERHFRQSPMVGLCVRSDINKPKIGDFVIRNILGVSKNYESMAIGGRVSEQQRVQFHIIDPKSAHSDLKSQLEAAKKILPDPAGALLFSCIGRGKRFYGRPNHDTKQFIKVFPDCPIGGFFCNGEIGPIRQFTRLHGQSGSFGLFHKRMWS